MRTRRATAATATFVALVAMLALATGAGAAAKLPTPGTPSQVAAAVAASSSITDLPSDLLPPLSQVAQDNTGTYYGVAGRQCSGVTKCDFGDTKSPTLVVLFGDSHAQMWVPALAPIATMERFKLSLVWYPSCPAADVSIWDAYTHSINKACNTWREEMVANIKKAKPYLVLLADRTTDIPGAGNKLISNAVWEAGLEATIEEFKPVTKVAVVGDITALNAKLVLPDCLAANATNVQACSVPNPNPKTHQHFQAEMDAAQAEDVTYLNPQSWLCTKTCSPVIGKMVAYYDDFHVSATYAEYLTIVWKDLLSQDSLLPPPS